MTKSRPSSKNSARRAQLLSAIPLLIVLSGCTSSTSPTFLPESVDHAVQDICQKEYKTDCLAKLTGKTLWVYLPIEDMVAPSKDKPNKYLERYSILDNAAEFKDKTLNVRYAIKPVPETEKIEEYGYNQDVMEKINNVWKAIRRVIFSLDRSKEDGPQFFCIVVTDIKNGFEMRHIFYYLDFKKATYELLSWGEFNHRDVQDINVVPEAIGNKDGSYLNYHDVTMEEFIAGQIKQRVRLKFQKPEVKKYADIDKEVIKTAAEVVKIYGFKDFSELELDNLVTNKKTVLNAAAVWARANEREQQQ